MKGKNLKNRKNANNHLVVSKKDGSVLILTLFIMMITLIAALGISSISIKERRSTGATAKSVYAFQVADTGLEIVGQAIADATDANPNADIDDVANQFGLGSCSGGEVENSSSLDYDGTFTIQFKDSDDNLLDCNDSAKDDIDIIKSTGEYRGIKRAVEITLD